MSDPVTLSLILAAFLLAGTVKGVVGLGLPTVSLAVIAVLIDLPTAMALMVIPSLVTNVWQGLIGKHTVMLIKRIWPFLVAAVLSVWLGAIALSHVQFSWLAALLGVVLMLYALISLSGFHLSISVTYETGSGVVLGIFNGILTGMTGTSIIPGIIYLQAIGLNKDQFIQSMGILFGLSTATFALALRQHDLFSGQLALMSTLALIPSFIGMWIGQHIRKQLSEELFRRILFISLGLLGFYIVIHSIS